MTLGERLKQLIEERGLEHQEFGEMFNLAKSTVSGYVNNNRTPSDELKKKFADYFDVTVDYLIGKSDIKKPEVIEIDSAYLRLMQDAKKKGISPRDIERMIHFLEDAKNDDK